ncbi:MAG TPA: hypothetical protein VMU95_16990 [Trebonia sp.]|nr:hypothetical protein [Trebonia sp.]
MLIFGATIVGVAAVLALIVSGLIIGSCLAIAWITDAIRGPEQRQRRQQPQRHQQPQQRQQRGGGRRAADPRYTTGGRPSGPGYPDDGRRNGPGYGGSPQGNVPVGYRRGDR